MRNSLLYSLEFSTAGNVAEVLGDGWSPPEPGHIFAIGQASNVVLQAPEAPFGFVLEIEWLPFLHPPFLTSQCVTIEVNGRPVLSTALSRDGIFGIPIPPLDQNESLLRITFYFKNAISPASLGINQDTRELSVAFRRMRLLRLEEPWRRVREKPLDLQLNTPNITELVSSAETIMGVALSTVFSRFEMLSGNCDMGLALREIGYESLSFLRFAGATPMVAIKGLDTNFGAVGENVSLITAPNGTGEWMIEDSFGLGVHTGQSSNTVSGPEVLKKFKKHVTILRRKFLEDIEEGDKIFVCADHKSTDHLRNIEDILPLYLALNRHRPGSRLLWVCPGSQLKSSASTRFIFPGLVMSKIDLFNPPLLIGGGITVAGWVAALCGAYLLFTKYSPEY